CLAFSKSMGLSCRASAVQASDPAATRQAISNGSVFLPTVTARRLMESLRVGKGIGGIGDTPGRYPLLCVERGTTQAAGTEIPPSFSSGFTNQDIGMGTTERRTGGQECP